MFGPSTAGELLKWKVIVVFPFTNTDELAGVPFTVKSLASTVPGSAPPLRLTVKSVGAVPTTMLPHLPLVTEQPVGVGVGVGEVPACSSNEPLSVRPFISRSKPGPRWSKKGGGVKFGSPASMAGLPGSN